jgi:hypothetical protein
METAMPENPRELIAERDEEALFADGWDDCIIGTSDSWCPGGNRPFRVVYDAQKIIDKMMREDGASHEEAVEHFEFNIAGAYVGPRTPIYVWPLEE